MNKSNPINIRQIDHVVIRVVDLDHMTTWYCDVLGCKLERGPGDYRIAQLRAGNSLIDLVDVHGQFGRKAGAPPDHSAPNVDHVCLQVDPWNSEKIESQLKKHGVQFGEIQDRYGATGSGPSMYLKDPEGNTIELKGVFESQSATAF